MSSTNRGAERANDDQYFTRWPTALAICERLLSDEVIGKGGAMLEPSCGKGAFLGAMAKTFAPEQLHALDLDPSLMIPDYAMQAQRIWTNDFRVWRPPDDETFDAIIGNPPFSQAEEHIERACTLLKTEQSAVVFLLRVNFLAGIERCSGLFRRNPPEFVYVLDKRPAFKDAIDRKTGKLKKNATDSCEYAAFVFRKKRPKFEPVVRFLTWRKYLTHWEYSVERQRKAIPKEESA